MTPKQERFVQEYLIDLNATQAATRAGYSARTANEQGARLLANASIAAAVQEAKDKRAAETGIDAAWVLKETKEVYLAARASDKLSAALRAIELAGKHVGVQAFKDVTKTEHDLSDKAKTWLGLS